MMRSQWLRSKWYGVGLLLTSTLVAAERPAWTTSRLAGSPDPAPPYRVEPAFPQLTFEKPLDLTAAPGSDRLFVAEQSGRILSFVNESTAAQSDLVVDLRESHPKLTALYAITFHPRFAQNRFVYVCYVEGSDVPDGTFVSRFEMSRTDPPVIDPATEQVVIRWWSGGHNGCALKFGPDGYLYISTGDGGAPSPPDPLLAGQDMTNVLSSILRIDVDHPNAGQGYRVPEDNPFAGLEHTRPEIWAYGFRNPWRMSFDPAKGDLWVGDVGWQLWEMIYRVEKAGNYGWPIMEGPQPVLPETRRGPTPILPPTVSHPHSEASSITGGYVYHGDRLPALKGVYVYGDFQTGTIWGLRHDGRAVTWQGVLAQTPLQIVSFGEDRAGELLIVDYERSQQIFRLVENSDQGADAAFPRRLSETGLFTSVEDETPAAGVMEYKINAEPWADHTSARRWMALPGTEPLAVGTDGNWAFPDGAVLVKTIGIELEQGVPASRRRLETQILLRTADVWRPYTYLWNDEQTDAVLAETAGSQRVLSIVDPQAPGGTREQTYRFASRAECQMCHNPWVEKKTTIYGVQSASPLGISVAQLNRTVERDGGATNQLAELHDHGWLTGVPEDPDQAPRYADPYDSTANRDERARAYLQVNCAHCHQPHAGGTATIDLSYGVPLADAQMIDVRPAQGAFGISDARIIAPGDPAGSVLHYRMTKTGGGRMPRLGSDEVDEAGVQLIREWITAMPGGTPSSPTDRLQPAEAAAYQGLITGPPAGRADAILQLTNSTRGALALLTVMEDRSASRELQSDILAIAGQHPQAEVRDLFERFLPASQRVRRLGTVVDAASLLSLPADAERGRSLFFADGAAACQSCHKVGDQGTALGPDVSEIGKKYPPRDLLTHLLEPSRFIDPRYVTYVVETTDGLVLSGLLVEQTDAEVVLKTTKNEVQRIPAANVEILAPQQKSLMPELLLRDLTPQQAADLLAYLSSLK